MSALSLPANFRRVNDEVFYALERAISIDESLVAQLVQQATDNPSGKARICFHADPSATVHDMLIALDRKALIQPHKHLRKEEAFQLITGALRIICYSAEGEVTGITDLAPPGNANGLPFYTRMEANRYHCVIPLSDGVVFREVTNGPFEATDTLYADWTVADPRR